MVGKQNILLHVASGNREERDVDTDFILSHCTHSVMGFRSGGQDNSIETKRSNTLMAICMYNFMSQKQSMRLYTCILIY